MEEKDLGQELIQLIRQLVQDEIKNQLKDKVEYSAKGRVTNVNADTVDVYILEGDCTVKNLRNESGYSLVVGDYVKVYYTQHNYANGYVGYKF